MCIVNDIKVDADVLQELLPELNNPVAIHLWVQQLVDYRIKELLDEGDEALEIRETANQMSMAYEHGKELYDSKCDMTPEELYEVISNEIDHIYAQD